MGAPAVTTTPFQVPTGEEPTSKRRRGAWVPVVGLLFTLVGGFAVLVIRDGGPDVPAQDRVENPTTPGDQPQADTATTVAGAPATDRAPGAIGPRPQSGAPTASPSGPPPATPEQVAELLAGLPLQLEQAATSGGQPRELPPEEVEKIIEDLLRQIGAQP